MVINGREVTRGLIIDLPWIELILNGLKTWEMRTRKTKIRGDIALIQKGTGTIVGLANLTDCKDSMNLDDLELNFEKHQVDYKKIVSAQKWNTPWVLSNVERLESPIPYKHKTGAVIWVDLS